MAAPKKVTIEPTVINLVITGPTFFISPFFKVNPPSNKIILIAKDTKKNKLPPGKSPSSPFHLGSIHLVPSALKNSAAIGPTNKPIRIKGKIAGIFNFHATHCANIPSMIMPANSTI